MPFSCQIHFRGLVVFAFDKASRNSPQAAKAFLTRSEAGERFHRPLLAYYPVQLDSNEVPVAPDPLQVAPDGSTTALRELKNEILTLDLNFAERQSPGLTINQGGLRKPPDLNDAATFPEHRPCFDFVPNLAQADPRMIQPVPNNGQEGILEQCLQSQIPRGAPITARLDFDQGDLRANANQVVSRWLFQTIENPAPTSPIDQPLAESAVLVINNLDSLRLRSTNGPDLVFRDDSDPIQITLSNEEPMDFSGTLGRGDDYSQLYKIFKWQSGRIPPVLDRLVPHETPKSIREQLCGVAMVI